MEGDQEAGEGEIQITQQFVGEDGQTYVDVVIGYDEGGQPVTQTFLASQIFGDAPPEPDHVAQDEV
jgi:hypothetical protein